MNASPHQGVPRRVGVIVAALAACGLALSGCGSSASNESDHATTSAHQAAASGTAATALNAAMRSLWAQHMEWTWSTVVAFASGSPGLDPTVARLLRNQADIGNAVATYYGADAGKQLTTLLSTHITDAVPVLTAAKAGDTKALNQAVAAWYANAQQIADFLSTANPAWNQAEMREMMKMHITQTIAYASDVISGNWVDALKKYDEAETHMTAMADMLSQGIVEQFPDKF